MKNMYRLLPLLLIALYLPAQVPKLDKAPQDVDDALRARIKQFYDYHVTRKFRLCEPLIAEDSLDDFLEINKPPLENYHIGDIEYSDNFTKAKAMIVGKMPVLMPMVGAKIMERPFTSFWKVVNGQWFWYYNKAAAENPFGTGTKLGEAGSVNQPPDVTLRALQSAVKMDRSHIEIAAGKPESVKITNTLPGPASLRVQCPLGPLADFGITAAFDKKELKANESATLTITADPKKRTGQIPLQVIVAPTNQILDLAVNVTP